MSFGGMDGGGIEVRGRESRESVGSSRCFVTSINGGRGGKGRDRESERFCWRVPRTRGS